MIKLVTGIFSGLVLSHMAMAEEPAVYQDEVLTIPGTAVINADGSAQFYRNVRLQDDGGGQFHVLSVEEGHLATVESALVMTNGEEVEVLVEGTMSACAEVGDPAVSFMDGEFTAVLPESVPDTDTCTEPDESFEHTFALDIDEAGGSAYTVTVNEVTATTEGTSGTGTGTGGGGTGGTSTGSTSTGSTAGTGTAFNDAGAVPTTTP